MDLPRDAMLLRVFIGEDARFQHRPLYQAIVLKAREVRLAGATVLRDLPSHVVAYGTPARIVRSRSAEDPYL